MMMACKAIERNTRPYARAPHVYDGSFEEEQINASFTDGQQSQDRTK
jgi:hypothetical protein